MDNNEQKKMLLAQYKKCIEAINRAEIERQKLSNIISQICGKDMATDVCTGDEIEFRYFDDPSSILRIEDVLDRI